jgi:hypothetical protein
MAKSKIDYFISVAWQHNNAARSVSIWTLHQDSFAYWTASDFTRAYGVLYLRVVRFSARSQICEISLVMCVCISVCPSACNNSAPIGRIFCVWGLLVSLKSDKNIGHFTWGPLVISGMSLSSFWNQHKYIGFSPPPRISCRLWDIFFLYISFIYTFSLLETISTFMWVIEGDIRQ